MPGLIGPDRFREVAQGALELTGVDGVEVLFMHDWGGLTRFAKSEIHQSTFREDTGIRVRVVANGRVGVAAANVATPEGALKAAKSAKEMAEVVAADPMWPGLAPVADVPQVDGRYDETTAGWSPETRADAVADLIGRCEPGFTAAGAYETQAIEIGVAAIGRVTITAGVLCPVRVGPDSSRPRMNSRSSLKSSGPCSIS